jgi:hypothetical protein
MTGPEPYRGPDTFELRHRDLFFGRSAEGRVVASMIASEPLSILTGASGTGKSSLLKAQILPTLIERGWCAIYAHPQGAPLEALREELLAQAIPDPMLEVEAIEALLRASQGELEAEDPLSAFERWFHDLSVVDPRRHELLEIGGGPKISRYPLIVRLLAGLRSAPHIIEQVATLAAYDGACDLDETSSLAAVRGYLEQAARGREKLLRLLTAGSQSLGELAERIWLGWAQPLGLLGLVFVLDQAEELYTSFGVTQMEGAMALHDWRLREALFEQVRGLTAVTGQRPLRFCFSLRPEWYAFLRISLGQAAPDESKGAYFLARLGRESAREAIEEPARVCGGGVDEEAIRYVLEKLSEETDRHEVDPFLLAITMHIAWQSAGEETPPSRRIQESHVRSITGDEAGEGSLANGAMHRLLNRAFTGLNRGQIYDVIGILSSLFNEDRTRRIVPQNELVDRPLRDRARLLELLDRLQAEGLVRRFNRGELTLVEVRHERLSQPVFEELSAQQGAEDAGGGEVAPGRFRSFLNRALTLLTTFEGARLEAYVSAGLEDDLLPAWANQSLRSNYEDVAWDPAAARVLLTSLLQTGPWSKGKRLDGQSSDDNLDWPRWRAMVGDLMAISSRRIDVPAEDFRDCDDLRRGVEDALLRGARLTPDSARACLDLRLAELATETRVALLRSLMSSPATYRNTNP